VAVWLACVGRRWAGSTRATTRSPSRSSPALGLDDERLVVAEAHDVQHAPDALARLAFDDAGVVDLAAARRVERRFDELDEHLLRGARDRRLSAARPARRRRSRRLHDRLVARELGGEARALREGEDALARGVLAAAARRRRAPALLAHHLLEALLVDAEALLGASSSVRSNGKP
jgi:hypothetical protein